MPYKIIHHPNGTASVVNTQTGQFHAKHTTEQKAEAQLRLLNAIEHGYDPKKGKKK